MFAYVHSFLYVHVQECNYVYIIVDIIYVVDIYIYFILQCILLQFINVICLIQ